MSRHAFVREHDLRCFVVT